MRIVSLLISAILLSGCTTGSITPNMERSEKQVVKREKSQQPDRQVNIPGWKPGGPGDTDGKPGEPLCPDCDYGGPVAPIKYRHKR